MYSKVFSATYKRASVVPIQGRVSHTVQNAAIVPQVAIKVATASNEASTNPHFPSRAILADIGPMTQIMKAENEPRKAIRELNSGTIIDTVIDNTATDTRSTMKTTRLKSRRAVEG